MKLLSFKHKNRAVPSSSWLEGVKNEHSTKRIYKNAHFSEWYQRHKLATSIHNACFEATGFIGEAEDTALRVCHEVEQWLENKTEVTSADIRRVAARTLRRYNPMAAYAYAPSLVEKVQEGNYGFIRL